MKQSALIVSSEIELRLLTQSSAPALFALVDENRAQLRQWLPWVDQVLTPEDSGTYIEASQLKFHACQSMNSAIVYKGEIVGMCGFNNISAVDHSVAIGYWLGKSFQGQGIVTTCVKFLTDYAFDTLNMNSVRIAHAIDNAKSGAVVTRCGFHYEGTIRSAEFVNDEYVDIAMYSVLKSEWLAKREQAATIPNYATANSNL